MLFLASNNSIFDEDDSYSILVLITLSFLVSHASLINNFSCGISYACIQASVSFLNSSLLHDIIIIVLNSLMWCSRFLRNSLHLSQATLLPSYGLLFQSIKASVPSMSTIYAFLLLSNSTLTSRGCGWDAACRAAHQTCSPACSSSAGGAFWQNAWIEC